MRTAPISSAIPARALASTERVTGSSFLPLLITLLQHEGPHPVDGSPPAGADDAGGLLELHDRRTRHLRALAHLFAVQDRHLLPLAVEVRLPAPRLWLTLRRRLFGLRPLD